MLTGDVCDVWLGNTWVSSTDDDVIKRLNAGGTLSPDIGQFDLLGKWFDICDETHQSCGKSTDTWPTRVVFVGHSNKNSLQLQELESSVDYIALSHCWGDKTLEREQCLTTDRNYSQRKQGFQYDQLPRLFQNAIEVTRNLGKDYLWIDALCIIQGNKDDWQKEGKKMEDVFASAYCTIAPSSATCWVDGFLSNFPTKIPIHKVCQSPNPEHDFSQHVDNGPLSKRAWVLQERILSRRTIFFTSRGIYWECGNGVRCGNLTILKCPLSRWYSIDSNFPSRLHISGVSSTITFLQELIKDYTSRCLTVKTDRVLAFSGLAKRISKALDTYENHGIFENVMHRLLLWKRPDSKTKPLDYEQFKPPSWSWMAYNGRVDFMTVSPLRVSRRLRFAHDHLEVEIRTFAVEMLKNCEMRKDKEYYTVIAGQKEVGSFYFDTDKTLFESCVVIGIDKEDRDDVSDKIYYILIVDKCWGQGCYRRLGVGKIQARYVSEENGDGKLV
ncbi:HET domain-containing protein [Aspergillus ibericus CBS 121593]|uniref:HET-domain-containing protein n=1 Tax=Aspergillus ibericus CBS 121593 TaxID=1448316 RepID=A0A395GHB9_9EURO|nr:HET-domain-containing protein [Aspergillus ibericus CBS 121593]RAK94781.1 HET-domain-containing protein [Aspergillus ibericus CBS 121593]